jgi:hypothetical protein
MLFTGSKELLPLSGTQLMADGLKKSGTEVYLTVYPGRRHAGQYSQAALRPTIAFLWQHLIGASR